MSPAGPSGGQGPGAKTRLLAVLCRPEGAENIGAVCRGLANFGFSRLRLVPGPEGPTWDTGKVYERALGARGLFDAAPRCATLAEALADVSLAVGFSARLGQKRKGFSWSFEALRAWLGANAGPVALVFGNEKNGLSEDELALCHAALSLPTDPGFPSLNLSHAAQIAFYEAAKAWEGPEVGEGASGAAPRGDSRGATGPGTPRAGSAPAGLSAPETDALAALSVQQLQRLGLYKIGGAEAARQRLRDLFARAGLRPDEAAWVEATVRRIGALGEKAQAEGPEPGP